MISIGCGLSFLEIATQRKGSASQICREDVDNHALFVGIPQDLAGFDFEQSEVDHGLIRQLADLSFTEAAHNLGFIGGTGTGKTHLARALGVLSGITQHGKRCASTPPSISSTWRSRNRRASRANSPST